MKFKYQMHTHTSPCSKCARMTPEELVKSLSDGGFAGCVLTNHFIGGNTGIDRNLPWKDFVAEYEKDYLECKKAAKNTNLDIIFGIEQHLFDGLEILCYGITPQFLYDHPELQSDRSLLTWSKALRDFGALCIQAHPFRDRAYITNPRVLPNEYIDGIEVFNACNNPEANVIASNIASSHADWILISGADAHLPESVCWSGISSDKKITDETTLVDVLKSGKYQLIL